MVDYEFQNEDTGKEMVKKLLRIWSIKKGKEKQSIVAITFCVFTSVVISLLVSYILRFEFISGLLLFIGEYATLTYVAVSYTHLDVYKRQVICGGAAGRA